MFIIIIVLRIFKEKYSFFVKLLKKIILFWKKVGDCDYKRIFVIKYLMIEDILFIIIKYMYLMIDDIIFIIIKYLMIDDIIFINVKYFVVDIVWFLIFWNKIINFLNVFCLL